MDEKVKISTEKWNNFKNQIDIPNWKLGNIWSYKFSEWVFQKTSHSRRLQFVKGGIGDLMFGWISFIQAE